MISQYTKHLDKWMERFDQEIPKELIDKSIKVIGLIHKNSCEINLYWKLRAESETWSSQLEDLIERLKSI